MSIQIADHYSLAPGDGQHMAWFTADIVLKAATADLGIVEIEIHPGEEPPLHVHSREDEWFYVLDGEARFYVGDAVYEGSTGTFVSFPREIPHTFEVIGERARLLMINTPGGFERMFELAPQSVDDAMAAFDRYGIQAVGPHPRDAQG